MGSSSCVLMCDMCLLFCLPVSLEPGILARYDNTINSLHRITRWNKQQHRRSLRMNGSSLSRSLTLERGHHTATAAALARGAHHLSRSRTLLNTVLRESKCMRDVITFGLWIISESQMETISKQFMTTNNCTFTRDRNSSGFGNKQSSVQRSKKRSLHCLFLS